MQRRPAAGFTLFEVMISLLIMTVAILVTAALLPVGLRAQQLSRSQMYAATTAMSLAAYFHNAAPKPVNTVPPWNNLPLVTPQYVNYPGVSTATTNPPLTLCDGTGAEFGWAGNLRYGGIYGCNFQYNAEEDLAGWYKGVYPVPPIIAGRLDSDGDEIQNCLAAGGELFYPDPNFEMGMNAGAAMDLTMQSSPSPELQKLVFAFTSLPQQNILTSFPAESLPWYEVYPFPPAWLSEMAMGGETRYLGHAANPPGEKTGVSALGMGTGDWSWTSGYLLYDDGGHAAYNPVVWRLPTTDGLVSNAWNIEDGTARARWYNWEKPLDDPNAWYSSPGGAPGEPYDGWYGPYGSGRNDAGLGWYEGCAYYQGRNWRYFANHMGAGNLWLTGNGQSSPDPTYAQYAQNWAYWCFQRLSGADDAYLAYPRGDYTNTRSWFNYSQDGTLALIPSQPVAVTDVIDPVNNASTSAFTCKTVSGAPQMSWPSHPPAVNLRAGWLPVRALMDDEFPRQYAGDNPSEAQDMPIIDGTGNLDTNTLRWALAPQTCKPPPTYEMRANYRDRAIDLWQAVMPTHSNIPVLVKNTANYVDVQNGGTMVDCDKYEYPPDQLNLFQIVHPSQLTSQDWPIHPAQVLALSYLAHAALLVTGYGPPFAQYDMRSNQANITKVPWEALNWTYAPSPEENVTQIPQGTAPWPQGVYKDALVVNADAAPGSSDIYIKNDTPNNYVLYPGDVITFTECYQYWWYRYGLPVRATDMLGSNKNNLWCYTEFGGMDGGIYDSNPTTFPSDTVTLPVFRVTSFNTITDGTAASVPGSTVTHITITPPLPQFPANIADCKTADNYGGSSFSPAGATIHAGSIVRRLCNEADKAFARKVHQMCMEWAQMYTASEPYDFGAPRMANHQIMMDKPLSIFDLFYDAANPASNAPNGQAQRTPINLQTVANNPGRSSTESFYRWMVPNNNVPNGYFWNATPPLQYHHDVSNFGATTWGQDAFDMMVHNQQLQPPTPDNDQKRFWPVKPFQPFHRARKLSFWSVDWKSYEDAEIVPCAPVDWSKLFVYPKNNFQWLYPNGDGGTVSSMLGIPEAPYVWYDSTRTKRMVDTMGSDVQNLETSSGGGAGPVSPGNMIWDNRVGHFGADRNGNGKLDIGPVPMTTRMKAVKVADFVFYDPVLRVNITN